MTAPVEQHTPESGICINCLDCVSACPQKLLPHYLYHFCLRDLTDVLETYRLTDCTTCGNCSQVCPARLPLSETLRRKRERLLAATTGGGEASAHGS